MITNNKIIEGLKKHEKHYYVDMEGHKVCPKCYALKLLDSQKQEYENNGLQQYTDKEFKTIDVKQLLDTESRSQVKKWGIQTHSLFEWQNYTTEELGELSSAIAEFEYRDGDWEEIYKEAIQLATLSLKIAEMIKHENKK